MSWFPPFLLEISISRSFPSSPELSSLDFFLSYWTFISWFLPFTTELSCISAFPHLLNFHIFVSPSSSWNSILCTFLKIMLMLLYCALLHLLNFHVLVSPFELSMSFLGPFFHLLNFHVSIFSFSYWTFMSWFLPSVHGFSNGFHSLDLLTSFMFSLDIFKDNADSFDYWR